MQNVIIGRHGFNREILEGCKTLKAAKEAFPNKPAEIVKRAFYEVHPKKKRSTDKEN